MSVWIHIDFKIEDQMEGPYSWENKSGVFRNGLVVLAGFLISGKDAIFHIGGGKMSRGIRKKGVALPVTLFALVLVVGFVVSITTLNQGLKSQVFNTSNHQWSFLLAYSAFSKTLAHIHSASWSKRPFAAKPLMEFQVQLFEGTYDLFVQDTPGKEYQADLYVRTNLAGFSRLYFWRITYNDDLLDVSNRIIVEFFRTGEPVDFPKGPGPSKFSQEVDSMLAERKRNQENSDKLAARLGGFSDAKKIIEELHGRVPTSFKGSFPDDPDDSSVVSRPAAKFPEIQPPLPGEAPSAPGPGPAIVLPGCKGFPGVGKDSQLIGRAMKDLSEDLATVASEARTALDLTSQGKDKMDEKSIIGLVTGWKDLMAGDQARSATLDAMEQLVGKANANLQNAPSAEASQAMQEMVSSTMATAFQDLANQVAKRLEVFGEAQAILAKCTHSTLAQAYADNWTTLLEANRGEIQKLNSLMGQVSGFKTTSEAAAAAAAAKASIEATIGRGEEAVRLAKEKAEYLKNEEAQEEERAAGAGAGSGSGDAEKNRATESGK